jgi:cell division protein FtsW
VAIGDTLRRLRAPDAESASSSRRELPLEAQILLIVTLILVVFGQVMVYSASSAYALTREEFGNDSLHFVKAGILYTLAGLVVMGLLMTIPADWMRRIAPVAFAGSTAALILVLVPGFGLNINGATRWLALGPVVIQPSEFAKLGVLLLVALLLSRRPPPDSIVGLLKPIGLLVGVVLALIMLQPNLGTTLAICVMVLALLVVAGTRLALLAKVVGMVLLLAAGAIAVAPFRRERIFAFLDPWGQSQDGAYQVVQSMIAIGSGGIFGQGLGSSVQKVNFLPESHTDMIFAVIGEELGLIGVLLVIGLFGVLIWAGFTIAMRAADPFQRLVAAGATALIGGQAIINLGAVMGVLPLTGIPLPLISYGSSSRLVILALIGMLVAISREPRVERRRPRTAPAPDDAPPTRPSSRRAAAPKRRTRVPVEA